MGMINVSVSLSLEELNDLYYCTGKYLDQCQGMENALKSLYTIDKLHKAQVLHDKIGEHLLKAVKKAS